MDCSVGRSRPDHRRSWSLSGECRHSRLYLLINNERLVWGLREDSDRQQPLDSAGREGPVGRC